MIDKELIAATVLPELTNPNHWYLSEKGEHYKLLSYLCASYKLVYDVGSYQGYSAAAMSSADKVISYDVDNSLVENNYPENIEFRIGDVLDDSKLKTADLILLDTYHEGTFEIRFLKHLEAIGFKGVLVLDDIHLSGAMEDVWSGIERKKEDLTAIGHYSGTGIVYYG